METVIETIKRNQIKETLTKKENLEILQQIVNENIDKKLIDIVKIVCEKFKFFDLAGKMQKGLTRSAILKLQVQGRLVLPEKFTVTKKYHMKGPRCLSEPIPEPENMPEEAGDVKDLKLVLVQDDPHYLIYNTMMQAEHPLGAGHLAGRQIRYLISSRHGWLGGISFSASALNLRPRDEFIGWDQKQRFQLLDHVLGMSRFLLRPNMHCRNLASKVLSMSCNAIVHDFKAKYGFTPYLLESFVDITHYKGTCYAAANWIKVGETVGRGRNDRYYNTHLNKKYIFLYPLFPDFRERMGIVKKDDNEDDDVDVQFSKTPISLYKYLEISIWQYAEFDSTIGVTDSLLNKIQIIASEWSIDPCTPFSASKNYFGESKKHYDYFINYTKTKLSLNRILSTHYQRTIQRSVTNKIQLCGIASVDLVDNNKRNIYQFDALLSLNTQGQHLGILKAQELKNILENSQTTQTNPHYNLLNFVHFGEKMGTAYEDKKIFLISDGAADFWDFYSEVQHNEHVEAIVRARTDRRLTSVHKKLFDFMAEAREFAELKIKFETQTFCKPQPLKLHIPLTNQKEAIVSLRYRKIKLVTPSPKRGQKPVRLQAVYVVEKNPQQGQKPLEWLLLTTMPINSIDDAVKCLRYYTNCTTVNAWQRLVRKFVQKEKFEQNSLDQNSKIMAMKAILSWRTMLTAQLELEEPSFLSSFSIENITIDVQTKPQESSSD